MGLFSFGNKDAAPARRSRTSAGVERQGEARNPRASRASTGGRSGQESLLDPTLPEKQRARRRLVGAIALVLAAVVVLPMVLDSHPKPASGDIAVNIPRASKIPAVQDPSAVNTPASVQTGDTTTAEGSLSDNPTPPMANNAEPGSAPVASAPANHSAATNPGTQTQNNAGTAKAAQSAPSHAATNTPLNTQASGQANTVGNSVVPHPSAAGTTSTSRFVVSVGSFASDASAHAWLNKLKAEGVPAYLETKRLTDGTQRTLLRAGPFTDRANAEAAVKKVRDAGLSAQSSTPAQNVASGAAQ